MGLRKGKTAMARSRESLTPPWDDLESLRSQVESEIASDPDDAHSRWEREDPNRADWDWLGGAVPLR